MKYIRYALFSDMEEAQAALHDIKTADVSTDEIVLVLHRDRVVSEDDLRPSESDGKRGLLLGLVSGAFAGCLLALLMARLGVLPVSFDQAAIFGVFGGMLIGAIGGGLYGMGLTAEPLDKLQRLWREGNVLLTAEVEGSSTLREIEQILKRHHAIVAASSV